MAEATSTILPLSEDVLIRGVCSRREEQLVRESYINRKLVLLDELTNQLTEKNSENAELRRQLAEEMSTIEALKSQNK